MVSYISDIYVYFPELLAEDTWCGCFEIGILFSGLAEVDDAAAYLLEKAFESATDPIRLRKTDCC